MAEPKIYSKNYVTEDNVYTISHGSSTKSYLYDRDPSSQFLTSGANSDATTVSIEIEFYEGVTAVNRTVDSVFLLNHNLKTWTLYYWNGSAYVSATSEAADAGENTYKTFTGQLTSKMKIEVTATQTADQEKVLGELILCGIEFDIGIDMTSYDVRYRHKTREIILGDGSLHRMIVRGNGNRHQKYEARVGFRLASAAIHDRLLRIKEDATPFLWQPESTTKPEEIYFVHISSPWQSQYSSLYKTAGYDIQFDLKEI